MIRSCLFIPANNPAMLQNADLFGADAVIFDLEDAVATGEKDAARALLHEYLENFELSVHVIVRVNNTATWLTKDLEAIVSDRIDAILLPKADLRSIEFVGSELSRLEKERRLTKWIGIIPLIETARAVLAAEALASAPGVAGLMLGAEDLTADMEISRTKAGEEIFYPRAQIALIARVYRIFSIDTPFTDVNDEDGLCADATRARDLGMTAKAAIHPRQIPVINRMFSPRPEQIEWAQRVLTKSETETGVFSLDGKMVDQPVIERAKTIIEKAKRYKLL
jgi:citrate lyase subunit beta/citryl-CoA lyase